jgi:hypothetical protein
LEDAIKVLTWVPVMLFPQHGHSWVSRICFCSAFVSDIVAIVVFFFLPGLPAPYVLTYLSLLQSRLFFSLETLELFQPCCQLHFARFLGALLLLRQRRGFESPFESTHQLRDIGPNDFNQLIGESGLAIVPQALLYGRE